LENVLEKTGYDLICGDETINSIFKLSLNRKENYENDYLQVMAYLRTMEFYRFLPTAYNLKHLITPTLINFLKQVGLYSVAKKIYHKIKTFLK